MILIIQYVTGYDITKDIEHKWNIAVRQKLPSMTLNIHVVEVGCTVSGHFNERCGRERLNYMPRASAS